MIDFFADLLIVTGGIVCLIFWIVAFAAIVIEINDNRRERKAREVLEKGGAESSDP